jgi:hypothetical protein
MDLYCEHTNLPARLECFLSYVLGILLDDSKEGSKNKSRQSVNIFKPYGRLLYTLAESLALSNRSMKCFLELESFASLFEFIRLLL